MFKFLIFNLIFVTTVLSQELKLINHTKTVANANSVVIELIGEKLINPKFSFKNYHRNFYINEFKKNSYIGFIPISYYEKPGKKKVIVSFIKNGKKRFMSTSFKVIKGDYKSEKINVQSSKVSLNEKDKKRTKREYQEAMRVYKTKTTAKLWSEDFIMPMNSKITSEFGTKRVYNNKFRSYHSGVDFRAKIGTPIIASNAGMVKIAKNRFYAGNSVVINHGLGVYSCYFHLDKILVSKNEKVKKGQIIGYSGNTGRITGPHLHFAIRVDGTIVNPETFIKKLNALNDIKN